MSFESQYLFWILIHDFEPPHCTTCTTYCTLCNLQHSKLSQFLWTMCCKHVHAHAETYSLSCWSGTFVSWSFAPLGLVSEQPFIKMSLDLSSAANQQAERLQEGSWGRGAGRLLMRTHTHTHRNRPGRRDGGQRSEWGSLISDSHSDSHLFFRFFFCLILQHGEIRNAVTLLWQQCRGWRLSGCAWKQREQRGYFWKERRHLGYLDSF